MTIRKRVAEKCGKPQTSPEGRLYTLAKIRNQSPVVYSADEVMDAKKSRCDYFVLCSLASVTGIYIVEQKDGMAESDAIKQLCAGAKFMSRFIESGDCCAFLPVLVAKGIPRALYQKLLKTKIKLGHLSPQKIKHVKVGGPLPSILSTKGK